MHNFQFPDFTLPQIYIQLWMSLQKCKIEVCLCYVPILHYISKFLAPWCHQITV